MDFFERLPWFGKVRAQWILLLGAVLKPRTKTCGRPVSHLYSVKGATTKSTAFAVPGRRAGIMRPGEEISEEKSGPMDDTQHRVAFGLSASNHGVREGTHPSSPTRIPYPHPVPIPGP